MYGNIPYICKSTRMNQLNTMEQTRFDVRLPKDKKELIELAATLSGFKSKSEFIVHTLYKEANFIIDKQNQVIASAKDQQIFFDAILNPPKPNKNLIKAAKKYNQLVAGK